MDNEIKEAIEYFNGWDEGDNITITSDFIMNAGVLEELKEKEQNMSAVFETKDVLLALSFYMEYGEHGKQRLKELQETFEKIATDKVKLVKE